MYIYPSFRILTLQHAASNARMQNEQNREAVTFEMRQKERSRRWLFDRLSDPTGVGVRIRWRNQRIPDSYRRLYRAKQGRLYYRRSRSRMQTVPADYHTVF